MRRQALQPGNLGGEVQRIFNCRFAGDPSLRGTADSRKYSASAAEAADAGRCWVGLPPSGTIGGDSLRRRSAKNQTGARTQQAPDWTHTLSSRRANNGSAF